MLGISTMLEWQERWPEPSILHLPTCLILHKEGWDEYTASVHSRTLWYRITETAMVKVKSYHCKQKGTRQQGYTPPLTTPKHLQQLWALVACLSLINRGTCLPGLSCTLPGKSLDCWSHFCGRAQAGPLSEPWHSTSLNLDVSQVWLGCKQALFQKIGEDAFGHLQIQRRITKSLCSKGKKKLFKGHISSTGNMVSAKTLPGNRTFLWERTQVTHLSGMPMLRALEFHYKIWDVLCSQVFIHMKGLGALPSPQWPLFIGRLTRGSSPHRKES